MLRERWHSALAMRSVGGKAQNIPWEHFGLRCPDKISVCGEYEQVSVKKYAPTPYELEVLTSG